jgi:eukaryotic-like serine/threonine-protein kinase
VSVDLDQRPARTIGRYALFAEIASGGMASIHIGRLLGPVGFSRTVAIKRLHPQFARDPEFVTMFLDEARLAARIRHPNVASTLDVVATEGELFLVMEFIQGESLAQLVHTTQESGKRIPQEIVRAIMSGILHGLHAAHEAKNERGEALGIVHRDISPQNILIGTDGIARLLDFGIAKAVGRSHVTRDRHIKGKLSYMAPEQIENVGVDRRVDVYAAAVVLWELLTGQRLFDADSDSSKVMRVLTSVVTRPSSLVPGISAKLDRLVLRGMSRKPELRFETARDMALALEASGPMAIPSVVGAWVEASAHHAIAERAAHIAAVEQINDLPSLGGAANPPLPVPNVPGNDLPTVTGPRINSDFVEDSSIDLVPVGRRPATNSDESPDQSELALPHQRTKRTIATVGLFLVLGSILLWVSSSRRSTVAGARRAPVVVSAETPQIAASVVATPQAATATSPAPEKRIGETEGLDASIGPGQQEVSAKISPGSQQAPNVRAKPKAVDCNPPFTLDSAGIRHYKRECL